ncbi:MAG: PrsW family glutamic-type intramembrane protease [bacterium]
MPDIGSDSTVRLAVIIFELVLSLSLIVWMRRTHRSVTEDWRFYAKLLFYGGLTALAAGLIEIRYSFNLQQLQLTAPDVMARYGTLYGLLNNLSGSLIEELAKYTVAVFTILNAKHVHKLSDAIIYMIIIGLGFSLVEDVFFLLNPDTIAPYRLISFFVHSGTSAIIGYSLGRFMSGVIKYWEVFLAILWAITLHFAYNFSVSETFQYSGLLVAFITIYISLQIFILFRRAIEEEYRLGHRFRGVPTQRLLNLHQ